MRIATWNLWNSDMPRRYAQLTDELRAMDADVIALQECTEDFFHRALSALSDWPFRVFEAWEGEDEGLAILSRYPMADSCFLHRCQAHGCAAGMHVRILAGNVTLSLTNVHLPWDSLLAREKHMLAIQRYIASQQADFHLLMGDFNDGPDASVGRFLCGMQSLHGGEASPRWNDLALSWACHSGICAAPTLDPVHNPRWAAYRSPCTPVRMDRIYLMDSWNDVSLDGAGNFGLAISPDTGLAASDHYGVYADLTFHP